MQKFSFSIQQSISIGNDMETPSSQLRERAFIVVKLKQ